MMTLDEAIKHAEKVAEEKDKLINKTYATFGEDRLLFKEEENECKKCADEHRQLAEWLKDYKRLLEQEPIFDTIRAKIDKIYEREGSSFDCLNALDELKEFIDRYKTEDEGFENKLKDLSERVENIEKQMKDDKEEQLKNLKAELDYAKFRCTL